jgi:hypothetical protein
VAQRDTGKLRPMGVTDKRAPARAARPRADQPTHHRKRRRPPAKRLEAPCVLLPHLDSNQKPFELILGRLIALADAQEPIKTGVVSANCAIGVGCCGLYWMSKRCVLEPRDEWDGLMGRRRRRHLVTLADEARLG